MGANWYKPLGLNDGNSTVCSAHFTPRLQSIWLKISGKMEASIFFKFLLSLQ